MAHVRLRVEAPEGAAGQVVACSRSRAHDLVTQGLAERFVERPPVEQTVVTEVKRTVSHPRKV